MVCSHSPRTSSGPGCSQGGGAADAKRWTGIRTIIEARELLRTLFRLSCDQKWVQGLDSGVDCSHKPVALVQTLRACLHLRPQNKGAAQRRTQDTPPEGTNRARQGSSAQGSTLIPLCSFDALAAVLHTAVDARLARAGARSTTS